VNHQDAGELSLTGPDADHVLDSVLADPVTDADPSRGDRADGTTGLSGLPAEGHVEDGTGTEPIRSDRIDPTEYARPVEVPLRVRSVEHGLIRMDTISDAALDELAAAVVGSPGRPAVPADPIARPETPPEPGKGLANWAATLVVAGSWGHRARFRVVMSRPAGSPRDRKESD
jgi:hypothetical protein